MGFRPIRSPRFVDTAVGSHDSQQRTSPSLFCDNPFNNLANVCTGSPVPRVAREARSLESGKTSAFSFLISYTPPHLPFLLFLSR